MKKAKVVQLYRFFGIIMKIFLENTDNNKIKQEQYFIARNCHHQLRKQ